MIYETLKLKSNNSDTDSITNKLFVLAEDIVRKATEHLKLTIAQLPEFDLHDATHSEKVLSNIDSLIPHETMNAVSSYELFLIYVSAYLHDCAMALPEWELRLLKLTEGVEGLTSETIQNPLAQDLKAPYTLLQAMEIIETRKTQLYKDFNEIKDFVFICNDEKEFTRDLAERLIEYQEFRNGFVAELKQIISNNDKLRYLEYSELIRHEFVRITHSTRIETYVKNLNSLFIDRLGGPWGGSLAGDLATICKSHGEDFHFITTLEVQSSYIGSETANLQFVAMMLRLGDIIHFSFDRAPRSLFAEKIIDSQESIKHWKAKFQGLSYTLDEVDENGRTKIKYLAYCDDPSSYYFIQQYINWIDDEISNYFSFIHALDYSVNTRKLVATYKLPIADKVDRSQVKYNKEKFIPVIGMGFTLNQKKILELLMGVGLYKDKYLCLRELYQNSLDSCRCMVSMLSNDDLNARGRIEFGLGSQVYEGKEQKYLYCLDNGTGMTKGVIERFFLNIGNSYYNSQEFYRKSVKWKNTFKPTSQFGVGILSCFMIGSKIEITTVSVGDNNEPGVPLKFSVDGPHEYFYYMKPDKLDLERIGSHGTLVKVILNECENIYSDVIEELPLIIYGRDRELFKRTRQELYKTWEQHLFKLLMNSIGIVDKKIDLNVRFSDNQTRPLIRWIEPFDLTSDSFNENDIKLLFDDYRYLTDGYNPYIDYLRCKDFIETKVVELSYEGIDYYVLLSLPKPNIPVSDYRVLEFRPTIGRGKNVVLVDGIWVNSNSLHMDYDDKRDIGGNGIINFVGEERPQLSVDRNSITKMPESLLKKLNQLPDYVGLKLIDEVKEHLKRYSLNISSVESQICWDYIFKKFSSITRQLLEYLVRVPEADMVTEEIIELVGEQVSVSQFASMKKVKINKFNFNKLSPTSQLLLLGKLVNAKNIKVSGSRITIDSENFCSIDHPNDRWESELITMAIKADSWTGSVKEYDLVSSLWPIVPNRLFDILNEEFHNQDITFRSKTTAAYSNSFAGIASLDPVLINPKLGIFSAKREPWRRKRDLVGKFQNPCNDFWMGEVHRFAKEKEYFIYAFISPRELNEQEKISLELFRDEDKDYYTGVLEGWSILFLGKSEETIIVPGMMKRDCMVKKIRKSFWQRNKNIKYYFIDETEVIQN